MSTVDAVGQLVGLQAQAVNAPYLELWTRLSEFTLADLTEALQDRDVVRASVLRGTLLAGRTLTRPALRDLLAARWPDRDAEALAWSVQAVLPIVHPNGTRRRGGPTPSPWRPTGSARWPQCPTQRDWVRRYLAAFGPATVADMRLWSGVRGLGEVVAISTWSATLASCMTCRMSRLVWTPEKR